MSEIDTILIFDEINIQYIILIWKKQIRFGTFVKIIVLMNKILTKVSKLNLLYPQTIIFLIYIYIYIVINTMFILISYL